MKSPNKVLQLFMRLSFALLISITLFISGCSYPPIKSEALSGKDSIDLQGHRGARGLRPENTIPAFQYAIDHKMVTLELDTNLTKDGNLIVHHDYIINSEICVDLQGNRPQPERILDMKFADLRNMDCGSNSNKEFPEQVPVPGTRLISLSELFDYVIKNENNHLNTRKINFNVEAKFDSIPNQESIEIFTTILVNKIEEAGMVERTTVQSFALEALPMVKKLNQKLKTSALFKPSYFQGFLMALGLDSNRAEIIQKTEKAGADYISPHYRYISPSFVQTCHKKNIRVIPWTVNEEETMLTLLNYGVDGIISDYPNRLFKVYKEWSHSRLKLVKQSR